MNWLYENKKFKTVRINLVGEDIDLSGKEWFPSGYTEDIEVVGTVTLFGNNRIINGLTIGSSENPVKMKNVGLFPSGSGSYENLSNGNTFDLPNNFYDVGITNAEIYADSCEYAGIFAGHCEVSLKKCYATGKIIVSGGDFVGGLTGFGSQPIENCYTNCSISCDSAVAGGFVGYENTLNKRCNIYNCYCNSAMEGPYTASFIGKIATDLEDAHAFSRCYYNKENNSSIPVVFRLVKDVEDADLSELEPKIIGKTLLEMQSADFVEELTWFEFNGVKYTTTVVPCFATDIYNTNDGLPVLIDSSKTNSKTYKKYADVILPADHEIGNSIWIKTNSATKVYYTLDGTSPTIESPCYSSPITITETTELNILAVRAGLEPYYENATYTASPSFSDADTHWAKEEIQCMVKRGLFNGTSEGTFSPDLPMTRAMFFTVLGRLDGIDPSEYATASYSDVDSSDWFCPYINWAGENGIVPVDIDNQFFPNQAITREEIAYLLNKYCEYAGYDVDDSVVRSDFSDEALISDWAMSGVNAMYEAGIITGRSDTYAPRDNATRAEICTIFNRFIKAFVDAN